MRLLTPFFAIVVVLVLSDLHWGIMQTVAWVKMVNDSTEMVSLGEKVARTVSGEHPCERCLHLRSERNSEEEQTLDLVTKSQVLAPIAAANIRVFHNGSALFSMELASLPPDDPYSPAIEHPPRA